MLSISEGRPKSLRVSFMLNSGTRQFSAKHGTA